MCRRRSISGAGILVAVLILAGCSTTRRLYTGPELPANQISIVKIGAEIGVKSVDGNKLKFLSGLVTLHMLPGEHILTLVYDFMGKRSIQNQTFTIDVEAGKTYWIYAEVDGDHWRPYLSIW